MRAASAGQDQDPSSTRHRPGAIASTIPSSRNGATSSAALATSTSPRTSPRTPIWSNGAADGAGRRPRHGVLRALYGMVRDRFGVVRVLDLASEAVS